MYTPVNRSSLNPKNHFYEDIAKSGYKPYSKYKSLINVLYLATHKKPNINLAIFIILYIVLMIESFHKIIIIINLPIKKGCSLYYLEDIQSLQP